MAIGTTLQLLPRHDLVKTGPVDHADWVYQPVVGWLQKVRMRMGVGLLPRRRVKRLLEVGYGSGILMPELNAHSEELFGIDPHPHGEDVQSRLSQHGIRAQLTSGSAEQMPYSDGLFDCAIAISSLEFVPDLNLACVEINRVLAADGRFIVVTPGHSAILDLGLQLLTGENAKKDFDSRRQQLIPTLLKHFEVVRWHKFPALIGSIFPVYNALELKPKSSGNRT